MVRDDTPENHPHINFSQPIEIPPCKLLHQGLRHAVRPSTPPVQDVPPLQEVSLPHSRPIKDCLFRPVSAPHETPQPSILSLLKNGAFQKGQQQVTKKHRTRWQESSSDATTPRASESPSNMKSSPLQDSLEQKAASDPIVLNGNNLIFKMQQKTRVCKNPERAATLPNNDDLIFPMDDV
jgi:hypothetical protein